MKTRIIRKTTYASKGPEVTLRNIWGREGFDVWCNSWEAEIKIAKVRLRPNAIRKSQLVEQGITRTRREVHAEDSHKDNSLSEKAAKKSYEAGNCELHKTKFKQLIANAYMISQRMRRRGVHTQGKRRWVGCRNALTQLVITLRDGSEFRFKISTQRHHRDSEQKRASGNLEELTHTSDDWWKAK